MTRHKDDDPNANSNNGDEGGGGNNKKQGSKEGSTGVEERLAIMETRMEEMERNGEWMKGEIRDLRDQVEEVAWVKRNLEGKVETLKEEAEDLKGKIEREREEKKELCDRLKEIESQRSTDGNGGGERWKEAVDKRIKEVEERIEKTVKDARNGGGVGERERERIESVKQRCIIITDSNGQGATADSIRNHVPRSERDRLDIEVVVSYTLDDTLRRVDRGEINARGANIVVDNLTNDVRGSRARPAVSPQELVRRVDALHGKLQAAGAAAVITCQIKPMQVMDVTPHNKLLSNFLRDRNAFGCLTQIRLSFLRNDGFHVRPQFDSTIDMTYACALRGVEVPCPTPLNEFVPDHIRRRGEKEWPRIGKGQMPGHGW